MYSYTWIYRFGLYIVALGKYCSLFLTRWSRIIKNMRYNYIKLVKYDDDYFIKEKAVKRNINKKKNYK